jgi:hypothetical protein
MVGIMPDRWKGARQMKDPDLKVVPVNGPIPKSDVLSPTPAPEVFIVPPTPSRVTQEFKVADFLVDSGAVEIRVDTGIEIVRARKPSPSKYVSIHPEKRFGWIVPEDRDSRRDAYLVAPAIGQALMPLCRRAQFVAWVDPDTNYGIWPILQENSTGDINEFSVSAMKKVDMAIAGGKWYCFRVPKGQRCYGLWEADSDLGKA